jgi:glycosyltransferase involved in cell wall biosynthesis
MAKIVFVFDRVMHYHRPAFERLEQELAQHGHELFLFSGKEKAMTTGRVALKTAVVRNQVEFELAEWPVRSFMLRHQHGVTTKIKELRPAIVVTMCHSGTFSEWQIVNLKKQFDFKLVAWQCGYEFNPGRLKRWVLGKFIPHFDHHLAYHSNAKLYAIEHGARPDQVTVMHNTINEAAIACVPRDQARELITKRWPKLAHKKIVLYVGAILEEKLLEVIFEALDILNRDDVIFLMVGDGPHLGKLLSKYGHRTDFVSTGQIVDGVGPYFDAAEVYLLPGTGGLGINEAMAHSLPIISGFADGSADDLVVDGENGYRLRDGSAAELADRIAKILDEPEVAQRMGRTSHEWITGKFAFSAFIGRIKSALLHVA